jgi:hypothetical protein
MIIQCKQCQGEVSDDAEKCPHCGSPNFRDLGGFEKVLKWAGIGLSVYLIYLLLKTGCIFKGLGDSLK